MDFYSDDIVFDRGEGGVLVGKAEILEFYEKTWSRIDERIWQNAVAIDNDSGIMMVDLTVELLARKDPDSDSVVKLDRGDHRIVRDVLIYGIEDGFIKSIRAFERVSRLTKKSAGPFPANDFEGIPTPLVKEALEAAYNQYASCFTGKDIECLRRFLAEDVQFVSQSLPRLTSRKQLFEFFGSLWKSVSEDIKIHGFRYEKGWFFVDLTNTLTVHVNIPDIGGHPYAPGKYSLRGEVGYQLVNGKIGKIFDGVDPFSGWQAAEKTFSRQRIHQK